MIGGGVDVKRKNCCRWWLPLALVLLLVTPMQKALAACASDRVELQVLGSGGPELDDGRASSSYLIRIDGKARVLVDMGGGASLNFERAGARIEDLDVVLFTHFHVNHSGDFPALLKAAFFSARDRDLPLLGPVSNEWMPSATAFVDALFGPAGGWRYLNDFVAVDEPAAFHLRPQDVPLQRDQPWRRSLAAGAAGAGIEIAAMAVHHGPLPALAWRVEVLGCSIAFSGDMNNDFHTLARLARGADMLVAHNAVPPEATGVARRLHMPPLEIGRIAARAKVGQVIISHRMNRTLGREEETRAEIRKSYRGPLTFADDLDRFRP